MYTITIEPPIGLNEKFHEIRFKNEKEWEAYKRMEFRFTLTELHALWGAVRSDFRFKAKKALYHKRLEFMTYYKAKKDGNKTVSKG